MFIGVNPMMNRFSHSFRAAAAVLVAGATLALAQADYSTPYTISKYAGLNGIAGANDGTINYAQLSLPIGAAFDASGSLYVADSGNNTIRKISPTGISTTFAGAAGSEGVADGTGSNARFKTPSGVAVDGAGTIYVTDTANHTLRKITAAGVVTTLAGSAGNSGSADGTGTSARFNNPIGVALTATGDLLVADSNNHTIRRVTAAGVVTTFAGTAGSSGSTDATGAAARFQNPHSVTVDTAGNFFVSDAGNHTVRKITAAGVVTTFAGGAGSSGATDGTGTAARFNAPQGLAFDSAGNLYVADSGNSLLRKITAAGAVTTFAGTTGSSRSADGTGTSARFQSPSALAFDSTGTLFVSDYFNHTIRQVTASAVVTTWIGSPPRAGTANGIGAAGLFQNPYGIAVDSSRNLYLADTFNHTVRKISVTGVVSTVAGLAGSSGFVDGTGSAARFNYPYGIAVDSAGNLYVADKNNNAIRKITATGVVTTLAGSSSGAPGNADGTGSAARFLSPYGVTVDTSGNVFVADYGSSTIRKITAAGAVTTLAGQAFAFASTDGTGSAARFFGPSSIAIDSSGNLYVADAGNNSVRKVTAAGVVTTLAGQAGTAGNKDGSGTAAQFTAPAAVAVDAAGNVFVVDFTSNVVRLISPAGVVKTIAGSANTRGSDDGVGATAQFADPSGIAVDSFGTLYIVDSSNNLIRRGLPPGAAGITTSPLSQAVAPAQSVTLSVSATGSGLSYQWLKNGSAISGATSSSLTIASPAVADAGSYAVLVTAGGITAASLPATVSVGSTVSNNAISITTQPTSLTVNSGQSATFTVAATGTSLSYQWQKNGVAISGATSASYTIASASASDAASYTVVITSGSANTTSSAAVLNVTTTSRAAPIAHLVNLSILTALPASGDNFRLGYVVANATASNPMPVIIRAAGPSLGALGVPGTLDNPKIELFAGPTKTGENDDWGGSATVSNAFASVGAFPYVSANSLDAAALANLTSRDNSVNVFASGKGTGAVIAEVYDATSSEAFSETGPRLINVSVLKYLDTGFTIGFVLKGTGTRSVIVRAVGPGLSAIGVQSGFAQDPKLTLLGPGSTTLATNDNWGGGATLAAAFTSVGAFAIPAGSRDAAVVASLSAGDHTVQVSGTGDTSGVVLVEVYEVP